MTVFVASKQNKGFPCGSADKESACNVGVLSSIPGLGRFPREEKGYPLQFSGLENSRDYIGHGVIKRKDGFQLQVDHWIHLIHMACKFDSVCF